MSKPPYMFVTFRTVIATGEVIAVIKNSKSYEEGMFQTYNGDIHKDRSFDFLMFDCRPAKQSEYWKVLEAMKKLYETPIDGLSAIIKPVKVL